MNRNDLSILEKKIKEYFYTSKLKALDDPYRESYTGVTVPYIAKYVCKVKPKYVVLILLRLHAEGELRSLYCGTLEDIVFESKLTKGHWNYDPNEDSNLDVTKFSFFLKRMKKYLE